MFLPRCLPVLIGSLPITSHSEAAGLILQYAPSIPLWPQLPKHSKEGMVRQFLSGFPGLVDEGKRFVIDTSRVDFAEEMTEFYTDYLAAEADNTILRNSRFALKDDTAAGFHAFTELLESTGHQSQTVKGQVTGPITTGIGAKDMQGNSIIYDDNLRDMLVKLLALKGRWQAIELQRFTGNTPPIVFIDEPALVSFGSSAFTGISREMVIESVGEVVGSIQHGGALAGLHICANGDWGPALESATDIISFDAYSFFDNFILFKDQLIHFIQRGGILAWGIVPTGDPDIVAKETAEGLYAKFREQLKTLTSFGFTEKQLMEQTLIAPACGTGSLPIELALKVLSMNESVSAKCREYLENI
ncbi:hypothetical protein [Desulfosediminicola flagellatus]|uniref:hypothetical protein n=1 Tax=Desulfosediminicola flagellatus TaxID=2569541 RepID=UPI0010AC77FE|nr:hypothetical protein [Desulfosediminicola flagellatus]